MFPYEKTLDGSGEEEPLFNLKKYHGPRLVKVRSEREERKDESILKYD